MELSSLVEADIQGIQKQMKTAILNHQIGMMKLRNDPENSEIKKQIADAQNAIISLSNSQKFILQKLRNGVLPSVSSKACDIGPTSKGVIAVNGSAGCIHSGNNSAHNHMGQSVINQHVSVVRPRPTAVSVGTETVGLAAVARENQPTKTNGNYVPVTPNVGCDASSMGGKHAQEGPPCTRPHPTPPKPLIPSHQSSTWPVDVPSRSQINLVPRVNSSLNRAPASLSPSSSGGEDLDDDDDDDEEEEEIPKDFNCDEEDDMEELKYVPEDDEKEEEECLPKKENQPPCKVDPQSHPSDDSDVDSKLKFFAALGLVTRETCSEMQSRRGERKRRSTANPQFVYGNWDLSVKRKKNGYLLSSSLPLQLRKRGRPRLDGSSELLLPASYLPKSVSNVPYSKDASSICGSDHFNENQHQFGLNRNHQMLGHALGGALKPSQHYYAADSNHSFSTSHHTKKPLEHINGNISTIRKFCIVCKNISGPLVLCEDCDVRYHPFCGKPLDGKRHCPKCDTHSSSGGSPTSNTKKEDASTLTVSCKDAAVSASVPTSTVTCSAQVTAAAPTLHSIAAERAAKVEEKRRLLKRNQELNAEKAKLEQRVSELSTDLSGQAVRKRDLLSAEERTRRSIKRVHEFILSIQRGFKRVEEEGCLFKTTTSSGPCSVATDTSEGIQAS